MGTHYTDKRASVALVGGELARRGWKLWGWKEDRSDSMTDYYDPESWRGVATKDGATVCVDVAGHDVASYSGQPDQRHVFADGPCSPCNGTGKQLRDYHKPACTVRNIFGGETIHEPEEFHKAGDPCRWCEGTGKRKESRQDPAAEVWPVFQANHKGRVWHVERGGAIVASGVGVFTVADERWKGHHETDHDPHGPVSLDPVTCKRCGKSGEPFDMRSETCLQARPKLRAIVDRIEAAAFPEKSARYAAPQGTASVEGVAIGAGTRPGYLEIRFPEKPAPEVLGELKAAGFRWALRSACWYGLGTRIPERFQSEGFKAERVRLDAAHEYLRDPGEDAADRWNEAHS
ncbi:MAG: hypothetical protein ACKVW3_01775 [Phycisphaerales bacterium]